MLAFTLRAIHILLRPIARLSAKAATRLEWLLVDREIARIPGLARAYAKFRQSPEARWTVGADDVLALYRLVREHQPKRILEFGTGVGLSTAAMAIALRENGGGRITTLEQAPRCLEIARALIDPELQELIEFVPARPRAYQLPRVSRRLWWCGYEWDPDPAARFDFVLVDGPAGWMEGDELVSLDSGDLFRVLPHIAPGAPVYIDGRRSTVKQLERYLAPYLRLIAQGSEYTLFRRTDRPLRSLADLEIEDAKLKAGRAGPYAEEKSN